MGLLQDKFAKYDLPQQFMAKGVYPYFRTINSHQDTEVIMDGKKVLMFGSNSYMGLPTMNGLSKQLLLQPVNMVQVVQVHAS